MKLTSKLLKRLIKEELNSMSEASEFDQSAEKMLKGAVEIIPYLMGGILLPAVMTGALLDMGKFREEHGMEVATTMAELSEEEILTILEEYARFNHPKKQRMARELSMMSVDEIMSKFGSAEFNSAMRRFYKAEMAPQKTPSEQLPPAEQSDLFKASKITKKKLRKIIKEEIDDLMGDEEEDLRTSNPRVIVDHCRFYRSQAMTAQRVMQDIQEMTMMARNREQFIKDYDPDGRMEDETKKYQEAIRMAKEYGCDWVMEE